MGAMRIVAVVGADGSGKTTQTRQLANRLAAVGLRVASVRPVFLLFDPYGLGRNGGAGFPGSPRRRRLRIAQGGADGNEAHRNGFLGPLIGYLYALGTYAVLRWKHRREDIVVCDRYFYQFFYDLFGPSGLKVALAFPRPHLVVWLDAGAETIRARTAQRSANEAAYLGPVLEYYRRAAQALGFRRVDATKEETRVAEEVWRTVREALYGCNA